MIVGAGLVFFDGARFYLPLRVWTLSGESFFSLMSEKFEFELPNGIYSLFRPACQGHHLQLTACFLRSFLFIMSLVYPDS